MPVQVACAMRVSLAPVLSDLPFIGGISLSILNEPYLDFDLRSFPSIVCLHQMRSCRRARV